MLGGSAALAAVLVVAGLVGPPGRGPAAAAGARSWPYVASDFYVIGPDLAAAAVEAQTGVGTAPLGHVTFVAEHTSIVVHVDDAGANAGNGRVRIWVSGSEGGHRCLPARTPVRIGGYQPGERVSLYVLDVTYGAYGGCTRTGGTTGTLTVVP
jgi:hypothetical protein